MSIISNTEPFNNLPSTIILFITTHGIIRLDTTNDDTLSTFNVPEGMTIIRSLASAIGECNITNLDMVDEYIQLIKENVSELTNEERQIYSVNQITDSIREMDTDILSEKKLL